MTPSLPSDIFQPGQVLNNTYEVVGLLGRGGTGEVYLARNQVIGRELAIKALNARFTGKADYLALMKREEEMRSIVHDAVVRYSECSRTDEGHVILVMDYIRGRSLNDVMHDDGLSDRELLVVAHRVLEGLEATHAQGIVHRDLSPDNVILRDDRPDRATLIDFGIAKDTAAGARTIVGNEFAGKYEYAAPEQLDGQSDARSDLYALGASLLAAHRRALPEIGGTPGEIVRAKRAPLDTEGVASPLKDLIDWLAAVDPADRPQSARAALDRLDGWLKPGTGGTVVPEGRPKRRGPMLALGALAVAALAAGGAALGLLDRTPPLPHAAPFTFDAAARDGAATLSGHAPDVETAAFLAAAWADATDAATPPDAITVATGMPDAEWPAHVADLLTLSGELDDWTLSVSDNAARLDGLAPDAAARDAMVAALAEWSGLSGMTVATGIAAGPRLLSPAIVQDMLDAGADCGPLAQVGDGADYPLDATVVVTGEVATADTAAALEGRLAPFLGDRALRVEAEVLNPQLCAIRAALPPVGPGAASLRLATGDAPEENLTGIYRTGEYIAAQLITPEGLDDAHVWAAVIDNTGDVYQILPNLNRPETAVSAHGTRDGGLRRIPLLVGLETLRTSEDTPGFALRVEDDLHGKSELVVLLTTEPILDLRPRDESVAAFAQALREDADLGPGTLISVTSRILDLRP